MHLTQPLVNNAAVLGRTVTNTETLGPSRLPELREYYVTAGIRDRNVQAGSGLNFEPEYIFMGRGASNFHLHIGRDSRERQEEK
jgi:hypothetical protein